MCRKLFFNTNRFTLIETNSTTMGNSAALWLGSELYGLGFELSLPDPVENGWQLDALCEEGSYRISITGKKTTGTPPPPDTGETEWCISVATNRSFWDRFRRTKKISPEDGMLLVIGDLLDMQTDFTNIRRGIH